MKILKFKPNLAELILAGKKTVTWRLLDDKNLQIGDELELVNKETMEKFGEAVITNLREKKLGNIDENDYEGHEKHLDKNEMINTFKKYYGDKVDGNTTVKIIEFKMI